MAKGIETIRDVILILRSAYRQGTDADEPEGARYIVLSDTLAREMADALVAAEKDLQRQVEVAYGRT